MPTDNLNSLTTIKRTAGLGAAGLLALAAALVYGGGAAAAVASDVRLAGVDCAASPEVVEVKNFGNTEQDLTGWKLQSDGNDPFDLAPAGTIPAGGSIFIESGPGAQATFKWSQSQIFRDNDPTDYAKLVDNTGATKGQTACAQATAAPTAAPTPTPTPTAGQVPNGGGPPGAPDGVLTPVTLIYAGGSVIGAVVGLSVTWMGVGLGLEQRRKRRKGAEEDAEADAPTEAPQEPAPVVVAPARAWRAPGRQAASAQPLLIALVIALGAAVLVALLLQSQDSSGRR